LLNVRDANVPGLMITHRNVGTTDRDFDRFTQWRAADHRHSGTWSEPQFSQPRQPRPPCGQAVDEGRAANRQLS
jgi:hypothetical protein